MFKSRNNIINAQVLKVKTDRVMKRTLRDVKKRIRKGELLDSRSFGMYLNYIDAQYGHIKANVSNATQVMNYMIVRVNRIAETRRLVAFYDNDYAELVGLYRDVADKAEKAGRTDDFKQDRTAPPDMEPLKKDLDKLTNEDEGGTYVNK